MPRQRARRADPDAHAPIAAQARYLDEKLIRLDGGRLRIVGLGTKSPAGSSRFSWRRQFEFGHRLEHAAHHAEPRQAGASLREIASATSLSLRTIRTIVEKAENRGRASKRTNDVRRKEFNRLWAAAYRVRKAARDRLPQAIEGRLQTGAALVKAAKGLGR